MFLKPVLALVVCAPFAYPQAVTLPANETLEYNIEWRLISAGKATLHWQVRPERRAGWQVRVQVESAGLVSKLFKVEDDYTSIMNQALCAETTQLTSHEGSRQRNTKITFDAESRKANYLERDLVKNSTVLAHEIDIPACVHDVVGGLFYLRTQNLEPNQTIQVPVSDGKKSVVAKVEAQQREDVKTPAGTFKTMRYEIYLFNHVLYNRSGHLTAWLTDDQRKIPVQIRVRLQFTIGTITLSLAKHEN